MELSIEEAAPAPTGSRALRTLLVVAGVGFVVVGTIGIVIPLLPSTVFYLLAAACFGRSSPAAHRWLTSNRFFGSRLRAYSEERGATVATKVVSLLSLWAGLALAAWLTDFRPWILVMLAVVAVGVSTHLLTLKTLPRTR